MNTYLRGWKNFFNFRGRDTRKEFWIYALVNVFILVPIFAGLEYYLRKEGILHDNIPLGVIVSGFYLLNMIPSISSAARRLHDIGKSGWWQLILLIPFAALVLLYWFLKRSDGDNMYGPAYIAGEVPVSAPPRKKVKKSKRAKKETIPENTIESGNDYIPSFGTIDFTVSN